MRIFFLFLVVFNPLIADDGLKFQEKSNRFQTIKFEDLIAINKTIRLSDIATDVQYVVLETNENCLIDKYPKYYFSDSIIFVNNRDHILKFSSSGRFIKKIGSPGRGPGELEHIQMVSLIPEKRIFAVHSSGRLTYFSYDGALIKSVSIPYDISFVKVRNDFSYLECNRGGIESEKFSFILKDEKGNILSSKKNYNIWKNSTGQATVVGMTNYEPLYSYHNALFFKTVYNDTVFTIKNNRIVPEYFIDLGKYKLPDNKVLEQFSPQEIDRNSYSKYYNISVFESGGKKFITATSFFGQSKHFIVNQNNFVESTTKTILNDWDGGYLFWPKGSVNDNQVFMPLEVMTLKKYFASKGSLKIKVTSPLSETNLKNIVKNVDESNNPILMIVTLKSSFKI